MDKIESPKLDPLDLIASGIKLPKKTKFSVLEKQMVVNTYKHLQGKAAGHSSQTTLQEATSKALGIGLTSTYHILKEHGITANVSPLNMTKKLPVYSEQINEKEKSAIRRKVYYFYMNRELPTAKKVFEAVNEDDNLPNLRQTTFHKILKHLKFKYIKDKGQHKLMDKSKIILQRRGYLDKIMEYRKEERPIFYLDEMCINAEDFLPNKPDNKESKPPSMDTKRLILVHVGNENGFVTGAEEIFESKTNDYEKYMDCYVFENWFEKTVTKLGEKAVVVMDDSPWHCRLSEKLPNSSWLKADLQKWLSSKNIPFSEEEFRAELLMKIKEVKNKYKKYAVDEIAKKYSVDVLRLPAFHAELSAIEYVWDEIKANIKRNSPSSLEDLKKMLQEEIKNFSSEEWQACVDLVKSEMEDFYYKIDDVIDDLTDDVDRTAVDSDFLSEEEGLENEEGDSLEEDEDDFEEEEEEEDDSDEDSE